LTLDTNGAFHVLILLMVVESNGGTW